MSKQDISLSKKAEHFTFTLKNEEMLCLSSMNKANKGNRFRTHLHTHMVAKLVLFVTENDDEKGDKVEGWAIVYFHCFVACNSSNVQIGRFSAPTNKKL